MKVLQDMYEDSKMVMRCVVGMTGVFKGSALSPFLLAVMMDGLIDEVRHESLWSIMFADDILICRESRERWRHPLERRGIKIKQDVLHVRE